MGDEAHTDKLDQCKKSEGDLHGIRNWKNMIASPGKWNTQFIMMAI